jgi:hypothetical protein
MSWIVIIGLVLICAGFISAMCILGTAANGGVFWLFVAVAVVGGAMMNIGACMKNADTVNAIYKAAYDQDLTVTTSQWRQTPSATEPCRVKLRYDADKKQLFVDSVNKVATPELLEAICK